MANFTEETKNTSKQAYESSDNKLSLSSKRIKLILGYRWSYLFFWGNCEFVTGYKTAHLFYTKIEVFFTKYDIRKVLFCLEEK